MAYIEEHTVCEVQLDIRSTKPYWNLSNSKGIKMIVAKIAYTWVLYFNSWYFWNHAGYDNTGFDRIANPVFAGMFQSEKHVYFLYNDAAVDKVQVST